LKTFEMLGILMGGTNGDDQNWPRKGKMHKSARKQGSSAGLRTACIEF
jgi:hypothetical protein